MTTFIIALIAALGIGGGIAVASNSGGGGDSSPVISGPAVPGEEEPGEQEPGGEEPGGQEPGGEEPGGQEPGGEEPGGQEPGGEEPGGQDKPLSPNYSLISALVDIDQYKQVRFTPSDGPEEYVRINDGSSVRTDRDIKIGDDGQSFKVITGSPRLQNGQFELGGVASYRLLEDKVEFSMNTSNKLSENEKFVRYQRLMPKSGYLNGIYTTVEHDYNLYLGGSKEELSAADFGFSYEVIRHPYGTFSRYKNINLYDADRLYTGERMDDTPINFSGNALMWAEDLNHGGNPNPEVYGGSFKMSLYLPTATGNGSISMGMDSKYDANFNVQVNDINQLTFSDGVISEASKGYILNGKDGLEAVGLIQKELNSNEAASYSFGAKEVK
ncbi:hypothetical protein [Candidatus Proelusimicrobium volucris]|uniref:hypothetical protein n=1 Tax=Candidatus Proelusimicrobium volucris TaxID=3416225 RepID=UPI003D10848F